MANNYQQFSTMIPYHTPEQRDWLLAKLADDGGEDERPCSSEDEDGAVWVYAGEFGNIEGLADIVADFQDHFAITEPWVMSWANTCSKMRCDEFSGGTVAVYKGEQEWFIPERLADKWIEQQQKKEGK